jgi:hypothetical protein
MLRQPVPAVEPEPRLPVISSLADIVAKSFCWGANEIKICQERKSPLSPA